MLPSIQSMSIKKWVAALKTKHHALCVLSQHNEAIMNKIPTPPRKHNAERTQHSVI